MEEKYNKYERRNLLYFDTTQAYCGVSQYLPYETHIEQLKYMLPLIGEMNPITGLINSKTFVKNNLRKNKKFIKSVIKGSFESNKEYITKVLIQYIDLIYA